jgi:hypothetical protein
MRCFKNSLFIILTIMFSFTYAEARLGYTENEYESKGYVKLSGPSAKSDCVFLIQYKKDDYKIFADFMNGECHMVMYWRNDGDVMTKEELTSLMNINSKGGELKSFMREETPIQKYAKQRGIYVEKPAVDSSNELIWYNSMVMCVIAQEKKLLSCETNEYRKYRFTIKKEEEHKRTQEIEKNF